jgi:hypothetical protein
MKRTRGALVLFLFLAVGLAACGDTATSTPLPTTASPTTTAVATTPAPTGTPFNPIVLTITAGASYTGSPAAQVAPATPTVPPTVANTAPTDFPVYSGFKLINLGVLGQQVAESLSQTSKTAKSSIFYTGDSYDKIAAFYNSELPKAGYNKVIEQALPAFTSLTGNVLLYSKGTGTSMQVSGLIVLGPLDASLISVFSAAAPEAANLKEGNSVAIILTGLTSADLLNFQRSFESGSDTSTPDASAAGASTPAPTK